MTDLLAHVVEHQGQNLVNQPENPGNHGEGENRALERFQKFSPPKFLGGPDPDLTERWLEKMIDIFAALHYTEEKQETQTVTEYESQFTRLSKFAPELIMTEQRRIRCFVQGLNIEIQKNLIVAQLSAFSDAVEKTQRVKSARLQVRTFQAKKRAIPESGVGQEDMSTPPKFGKGNGGARFSRISGGASQGGSISASRGPCMYCGKPNHTKDVCWKKGRKCLRCGSANHQIANCPGISREGSGNQQSTKTNSDQSKGEGTEPKVSA
ncbi:uncharacterized protein LOC113774193 [Coffea eugenioides]|uniref:uncharacterized protein LOC113774193 n=1 Tax=Coffea eugenioides TaxID=49369 RepID=UPI000F604A02|nr:uncharacterized protein LOC113774193 [Coffea eugenioides]